MPIRRHRTLDDARRAQWLEVGDPRLPEHILQTLDLGERLSPVVRPPGVHRFRTLAEANAWRAGWPLTARSSGKSDKSDD